MHKLFFLITSVLFAIVTHAQNVGIGTATPKAKLEVNGNLNTPAIPNTTSSGVFRLAASSNGGLDFGIHTVPWMQAGFGGVPADFSLQALGGKVGIGTATPQYLLHIKSLDDAVHALDAGSTGAAWNYYLQNGTLRSAIGWSNINSALSFYVNGADRMVINNNGHVGIGNTSPSFPLHFANGNGDKVVLQYNGNPNSVTGLGTIGNNLVVSGGDYFDQSNSIRLGFGSSSNGIASVLTVAPSPGKVGINNPNPVATLDINGTVKITDGTQGVGKVLTSDANGSATWQPAPGGQVNFLAYKWFNWSQTINAGTVPLPRIIYDSLAYNIGGAYDPSTSVFTAPSSGIYYFFGELYWRGLTTNDIEFGIRKVGSYDAKGFAKNGIEWENTSVSGTFFLNAGEQVEFFAILYNNGSIEVGGLREFNYIGGYKLY